MSSESRVPEEQNGRHVEAQSSSATRGQDGRELTAIALLCWLFASPLERTQPPQRRLISQ